MAPNQVRARQLRSFFGNLACCLPKIKVAGKNIHFQRHTNFLFKCKFFSSGTLFFEGNQQKNREMKAGQINKYDLSNTDLRSYAGFHKSVYLYIVKIL